MGNPELPLLTRNSRLARIIQKTPAPLLLSQYLFCHGNLFTMPLLATVASTLPTIPAFSRHATIRYRLKTLYFDVLFILLLFCIYVMLDKEYEQRRCQLSPFSSPHSFLCVVFNHVYITWKELFAVSSLVTIWIVFDDMCDSWWHYFKLQTLECGRCLYRSSVVSKTQNGGAIPYSVNRILRTLFVWDMEFAL
jgi:hypothetical protein